MADLECLDRVTMISEDHLSWLIDDHRRLENRVLNLERGVSFAIGLVIAGCLVAFVFPK